MSKKGEPVQEFNFYAPKEKQTWGQVIHNTKEGTYFGRTPESWAKILLFYAIFYIVLAAMFAICFKGLYSTLDEMEPKWKLESSLIGTNPGLGFRPMSDDTVRGSVIQFDTKKPAEGAYWVELLDEFLDPYKHPGKEQKFCEFNQIHDSNDVCVVDVDSFGPCSPQNGYGYKNGRPCVFLKLNKIFNWLPEYYDNPSDLPTDMPADLKAAINATSHLERQQVWVSCEGQFSKDKEQQQLGEMKFYPSRGFPSYYYPYHNQKGYLSPLIAVQFEKLPVTELLNVECRAWAKNIIYNGSNRDRKGSVTFQMFVD